MELKYETKKLWKGRLNLKKLEKKEMMLQF